MNSRLRLGLIALGLTAAILLVYGQLSAAGFINFDDNLIRH